MSAVSSAHISTAELHDCIERVLREAGHPLGIWAIYYGVRAYLPAIANRWTAPGSGLGQQLRFSNGRFVKDKETREWRIAD